jgi:hypothetical protein
VRLPFSHDQIDAFENLLPGFRDARFQIAHFQEHFSSSSSVVVRIVVFVGAARLYSSSSLLVVVLAAPTHFRRGEEGIRSRRSRRDYSPAAGRRRRRRRTRRRRRRRRRRSKAAQKHYSFLSLGRAQSAEVQHRKAQSEHTKALETFYPKERKTRRCLGFLENPKLIKEERKTTKILHK